MLVEQHLPDTEKHLLKEVQLLLTCETPRELPQPPPNERFEFFIHLRKERFKLSAAPAFVVHYHEP